MRPTTSIDEAVEGADVVMMLRIQHERMHGHFIPSMREYFALFGLTAERVRRARPDVIVMHPGPMNRGVEIDSEVADAPVLGDPRAGIKRRGRPDGRVVSPGRTRRGVVVSLMKLLLKSGRVVDPATGRDGEFDVLIEDGMIARVGKNLPVEGADVLDVQPGWIVAPGLIDIHVHLREPGQEHKETIATGVSVRGGRVVSPPSRACPTPIRSTIMPASRSSSSRRRRKPSLSRVYPIGAVSIGSKGEQMAELGEQKAAGCVAFTDDGRPVATALLMRRALEYAGMLGVPIIDHCEDPSLKGDGVAHEGYLRVGARTARHSRHRRIDDGRARRRRWRS